MHNGSQAPVVPLESVEALRIDLTGLFLVYDTTLDEPHPGHVRFRGRFLQEPASCFDELRRRFEGHGFTPMIRSDDDRIALIAMPVVFDPPEPNRLINLALLIATIFSTLLVGASYAATTPAEALQLWRGWPFCLSIMLILGAHELGHYFAARYHKVPVTLPYFIPLPFFSIIGTLGAFIRLMAPVKNRRALLDVGAAGPLVGFIFAVPILLIGLATSEVAPLPPGGYLAEGNSILYQLLKYAVYGQFLPADGLDVHLNQVAWAGWVGLLVTGLNLIPLGQLDGGHIAFVLFGENARKLFWPVIAILIGLVVLTGANMWLLWVLMLFFLGRNYAQPLDDITQLDPRRRLVAFLTLSLFLLVFMPVPFTVVS